MCEERSNQYQIDPGYVLRDIAGEFLAVPVSMKYSQPNLAIMNETGRFLWEQLQQPRHPEELLRSLLDAYDVTETQACSDIQEFINILKENNLLIRGGEQ